MKKKKWCTPRLIVLMRGKAEEGVLTACKSASMSGAIGNKTYCQNPSPSCSQCLTYRST